MMNLIHHECIDLLANQRAATDEVPIKPLQTVMSHLSH